MKGLPSRESQMSQNVSAFPIKTSEGLFLGSPKAFKTDQFKSDHTDNTDFTEHQYYIEQKKA